jgi:hypothetical protein
MSGEVVSLDRREAIRRLVGAGLVTLTAAEVADAFVVATRSREDGSSPAVYRPRFFADDEYRALARLADLIIPSDETPGAREARVEEWIDFFVSESPAARQGLYRDGLARLTAACRVHLGSDFLGLPEAGQERALQDLADTEPAFFRALKEDTVFGFYTSEIGLKELDWGGQSFHSECPGCRHPAHLNWTPVASGPGPKAP